MEQPHVHNHACTQCACNNPILAALKEELLGEAALAALPSVTTELKKEQAQTLMISGGTIRPMVEGNVATVDAIGIAGGNVVVTGDEDKVKNYMQQHYPDFQPKVLKDGQTLLPGLIEPHVHIVPTALLMGWVDLGGFDGQELKKGYSVEMITKIIQDQVSSVKKGEWLLGYGLDPALMPLIDNNQDLVTINATLLDKITVKVPVLILAASMHTLYANTPALEIIYKNTGNGVSTDPAYKKLIDYLVKTHGRLQEAHGMNPAIETIPKQQVKDMVMQSFGHIKTFLKTANERGVTFLYDAGMNNKMKALLLAYLAQNNRVIRIGAAEICDTQTVDSLKTYRKHDKYEDVYIGNVKIVSDGSNQGLTGYQSDPYLCHPKDNYGIFNFGAPDTKPKTPPSDYNNLVETVISGKGWPLMIHANGDRAVQFAIDVYADNIPKQQQQGLRHRIEHCSLLTQDQLLAMKKLGVSPSFLIGHVGYWGYAFQEAIFKEKSQKLDLCKSALEHGMRITLHSDHQVSPMGPLRMMEQSITRIMEAVTGETVLNEAECLTPAQALKAITYDAAWQCNAEQWTGSLVAGNFADFVILGEDPLNMNKPPYMNMRHIPVLETWVDGTPVYINK
jgi:predicted amidohydrolase YtcJ